MADEASSVFEEQARAQLTDQLTTDFADDCEPDQIIEAIERAWRAFDQAPVRDFVPLFAARIAREELRRLIAERQE
ncbi:three-helix bundle dimerization domain-containing protein [Nonomuraea sp. NPDC049480]|uniref:three-helix bundle dimerization domain-containing protein n=1 Tax=Nonomuraea sp. NPDC049480 TaxID=3364353 RepID=UPI0037AAF92E